MKKYLSGILGSAFTEACPKEKKSIFDLNGFKSTVEPESPTVLRTFYTCQCLIDDSSQVLYSPWSLNVLRVILADRKNKLRALLSQTYKHQYPIVICKGFYRKQNRISEGFNLMEQKDRWMSEIQRVRLPSYDILNQVGLNPNHH